MEYQNRLEKPKLPTLKYRRLRGDMIETYKIMSGLYDEETGNILTLWSKEKGWGDTASASINSKHTGQISSPIEL